MTMRRSIAYLFGAGLLLSEGAGAAHAVANTRIKRITVQTGTTPVAFIHLDNAAAVKPPCSSDAKVYAVMLNDAGASELLRLATAAHVAGKGVDVVGDGTCPTGVPHEGVRSLSVHD